MNPEISRKGEQMRSQLRRRHIEEYFEKQRLALMKKRRAMEGQQQQHCLDLNTIKQYLRSRNKEEMLPQLSKLPIYEGFNELHNQNPNFEEEIMILILKNIDTLDAVYVLAFLIVHLSAKKSSENNLSTLIDKYNLCQVLYSKLNEYMDKNGGLKMVKLLLGCLKNCAFMRIESLRKQEYLQKYLPKMLEMLIKQTAMLVVLCNITEIFPLNVPTILKVCQSAYSKNQLAKLSVATIIMNFIALSSELDLFQCFPEICSALQHLVLQASNYSQSCGINCFQRISHLVEKVPNQKVEQLIEVIRKCKLQQFLLMHLQVGQGKKKILAMNVVETIVDKFAFYPEQLSLMNAEILFYVIECLEFQDPKIVFRALKIMIKLCGTNQRDRLFMAQKEQNLSFTLQNLIYHKNQEIANMANVLYTELFSKNEETMGE